MASKHQTHNLLSSGLFIASFLIVFVMFVEKLEFHRLLGFDTKITHAVQERIDNVNTRIMKSVTFLGSPPVVSILVTLASIFLYIKGRKREAAGMVVANAMGAGFNESLKYIFKRKRPDIHRLVAARGYGFPSGHSMGSVMFYGTISHFLFRELRNGLLRVLLLAVSSFMVLSTGISRIYLGVHYPSDVASGYAAAGAWLSACIKAFNAFPYHKR